MIKHLELKISGRVQGVFFRVSVKHEAEKLGLIGFAQNCDDGSVCIETEGDEVALRKFLEWCTKGPLLARVRNVQSEFSDSLKNFRTFEILT